MADITMCENQMCSKRDKCYRAMATPNEYRQSYSYFVPINDCFIPYDIEVGSDE